MPTLRFALVDVFADTVLTGNPLAVVDGGHGLSDDVLADVAREFNQSETTFVLPGSGAATRRLRSFTTGRAEVGGAGHNALGAWWWLAHDGQVGPGDHVQQIGADELPLRIERAGDRLLVAMRQGEPVPAQQTVAASTIAPPLALEAGDIGAGRVVSTGTPHLLVPAADRQTVDRAAPHAPALKRVLAEAGAEGCYLYATGRAGALCAVLQSDRRPVGGPGDGHRRGTARVVAGRVRRADRAWRRDRAGARAGAAQPAAAPCGRDGGHPLGQRGARRRGPDPRSGAVTAVPIRTEPDRYPAIGISQGFRVGDVVYISGQVGTDDAGAIVGPDFTSQAHQVFRNLDRALRAGGSDLAHVFKVTVYVTNVADHFEQIVALRRQYFSEPYPADTLVEIRALARPGLEIEIEAMATVR